MAEQDIINLVREDIEAFNANDMNRVRTIVADDLIYHEFITQRRVQGREEFVKIFQEWKRAFPDSKGTIGNIFASGNQAVAEITWEGTHQGDMVGPGGTIPPSGKHAQVPGAFVAISEGGKLKEIHNYGDLMTLLQQIEAMP